VQPAQRNGSVVGVDDDLGYRVLRVTGNQQWKPSNLLQPLRHLLLAVTFDWGIALLVYLIVGALLARSIQRLGYRGLHYKRGNRLAA